MTVKDVYCKDCKHMFLVPRREKYSLRYYLNAVAIFFQEPIFLGLIALLNILSACTLLLVFIVVTFGYNLWKTYKEPMCLCSGQDDFVNGGKIEGTAVTCRLYKDSAHCRLYVERPTIEQEIEETLKKLNEIRGFRK